MVKYSKLLRKYTVYNPMRGTSDDEKRLWGGRGGKLVLRERCEDSQPENNRRREDYTMLSGGSGFTLCI